MNIVWADDIDASRPGVSHRRYYKDFDVRLSGAGHSFIQQVWLIDGADGLRGTLIYDARMVAAQMMIACCVSPENHR